MLRKGTFMEKKILPRHTCAGLFAWDTKDTCYFCPGINAPDRGEGAAGAAGADEGHESGVVKLYIPNFWPSGVVLCCREKDRNRSGQYWELWVSEVCSSLPQFAVPSSVNHLRLRTCHPGMAIQENQLIPTPAGLF